jgi:UDP-glucuronate decarboxylase
VYGDPTEHPQPESYWGNVNPIGPRACYDESKRIAEAILFIHHHQQPFGLKLGRIFNTYGPRMQVDDGRVISNFINQALKNEDLTVYGDGSQTRSFCYIDDLVDGILKFMDSDESITGPINLGNQGEFCVHDLANQVIALTGSQSKIVYSPLPIDDPSRRRPDTTLAKQLLNWEPKISLNEGLKKTITYYQSLQTMAAAALC